MTDHGEGPQGRGAEEPAHLERGAVVGRYVVLRELGCGGTGLVYAAYDPDLDRKLALKVVAPGTAGADGSARLLRAAQALAKLSHHNVVAVHDVGTMNEQVWLAMERLRGQTLREWLGERRGWREVLEVMRKAGKGLVAAHAAGLLHGDFEPESVMVGRHGGVKVMGFGLARARTTAAADQLSFCATLWEALHGERPFDGNVFDRKLRAPTKRRAVPEWLRRVCERGLSSRPEQRFESMEALLDALANGRARARVRMGLAAVGGLVVMGAGVEVHRRLDVARRVTACEASGDEVDVAWNPARRQALHDALVGTEVSYASTTAEKVMPWLERQAEAWREARVEACLDAHVRGRWDAETYDRSLWCLDERRLQLESLVDELTLADAAVVQKAVRAAAGLASVDPCRDERVLEDFVPPPEEHREAMRAVRADVIRAASLERIGRYEEGASLARGALERAEALEWRPLSAAARSRLGAMLQRTGAYGEAEVVLEDAFFEATKAMEHALELEAAVGLAAVNERLARYDEARRWGRHAELALGHVHDGERLRRARLLEELAAIHGATGEHEAAKRLQQQALAIVEEALGPHHPQVAGALHNLATIHYATGAYDEAIELHTRAIAVAEDALGPEHPTVAWSLGGLANVHFTTGDLDEAKALDERALSILEAALDPEHPEMAKILDNLAQVRGAMGAHDEARALQGRALAILEKALGPRHPNVALSLNGLAALYVAAEAHDEAIATLERAHVILEEALGPEHPHVATVLDNLAQVREASRAHEDAKAR